MDSVVVMILAGGQGERLSILAHERSKPAIPFAGKYRIIDFTLSNCVNSGIYNLAILTQYQPRSLIDHIGIGTAWGLAIPERRIQLLQPYLAPGEGRNWYKGTADAVYQNLQYIEEQDVDLVLILSGDHICKMNYSWMLKFHQELNADVTLAVTRFPEEELERFGVVTVDEAWQVTGFQEKVKKPKSDLVSMGIYLFKKDVLQHWLEEDAQSITSKHDFGRDVLPKMIDKCRMFAYSFGGYWRDVGTLQSYWQTNMEVLERSQDFLLDAGWPIHTNEGERPPAIVSETAEVINSLISNGCVVEGRVEHSILSPGVKVAQGAVVKDSIIMSDSIIGQDCVVDYLIMDKEVIVEANCHLGCGDDFRYNRKEPNLLDTGLTIVGKRARIPPGVKIGRNCIIGCNVGDDDFPSSEITSGETIKTRRRGYNRRA